MSEEKEIGVKLPVNFKEFSRKPALAISYLCIFACVYLYFDLRAGYKNKDKERIETIMQQNIKITNLYGEVGFLNDRLRRADSAIASLTATLRVLKEVGKIQ